MLKRPLMTAVAIALLNSGCSTLFKQSESRRSIAATHRLANDFLSLKPQKKSLMTYADEIYVDTSPIRVSDNKAALQAAFPQNITISDNSPLTIQDIAEKITVSTKIPVAFMDLSMPKTGGPKDSTQINGGSSQTSGGTFEAQSSSLTSMLQTLPMDGVHGASDPSAIIQSGKRIDARFKGKLVDFLDQVTARLNLFWRYDPDERRIIIHQYDTKTFTVYAMPGDADLNFIVDNQSSTSSGSANNTTGGGGNTGGTTSQSTSGQSVSISASIKSWSDVTASINNMLSPAGRVYGNASMGTVTVTDTPLVLAEVKRYIDNLNKILARQVTMQVKVYNVELDDQNQIGIDWNAVYNKADDFALSYAVPAIGVEQAVSGFTAAVMKKNSKWSGTEAFVKALEEQGHVSLVTSTSAVTLNNNPVPVKVADETTYLASSQSGSTGTMGTSTLTTSLIPGRVVTGLTMTLLPKVVDANQLMLQFAMDMSALKDIATISSGDQSIQAPKIATKSFVQKVAIRSGETLILSGFNSDENSFNHGSTLDIPGKLKVGQKRVVTVILITPLVTEGLS